MSMTPQEQAELEAIRVEMNAIATKVRASRPVSPMMADVLKLRDMAPELVTNNDLDAFKWLEATAADRSAYDKLVARHNEIVTKINARIRAKKDARAAAKERAAVRSQMCPTCFMVSGCECE